MRNERRRYIALYRWSEDVDLGKLEEIVGYIAGHIELRVNRISVSSPELPRGRVLRPKSIHSAIDEIRHSNAKSFAIQQFDRNTDGNCRASISMSTDGDRRILALAAPLESLTIEIAIAILEKSLQYFTPSMGFCDVDVGLNPFIFPYGATTFDSEERSSRGLAIKTGLMANFRILQSEPGKSVPSCVSSWDDAGCL